MLFSYSMGHSGFLGGAPQPPRGKLLDVLYLNKLGGLSIYVIVAARGWREQLHALPGIRGSLRSLTFE